MKPNSTETDWSQKYRPTHHCDLVLPVQLERQIGSLIERKGGLCMLFFGKPGTGKTTCAKLINPENTYMINGTTHNSISDIRMLERTCSSVTLTGERRLVLIDEADFLSKDAQAALRGIVESLSVANDFVLTANESHRLSDAIRSRFLPFEFEFLGSVEFKTRIIKRLAEIASMEGFPSVEQFRLKDIVNRCFPDIRLMTKKLQMELLS